MTEAHWIFLLCAGCATALLCLVSLTARSRGVRAIRHGALAFLCLLISESLGGAGANPVNVLTVACLGAPGYALLTALARF